MISYVLYLTRKGGYMDRALRVADRVCSLQSEGRVARIINSQTVSIAWEGIGELDMPRSLLHWDKKFKVWELKQGREYV
jgi:hypothetical protein